MALFTATIFAGAVLLFWIQPLFTKIALPLLGGSPSVWNTAMVFFQAMLLAGYAYAHVLTRTLAPSAQLIVHAAILGIAALFLPAGIEAGWRPEEGTPPALWLLALLFASLGAPFFAVAATAPLLQRWFSQTDHPHAQDPYFLYAASNAGSVAVLLTFPFLIEPQFTNHAQAWAWTAGFAVLALGILGCGATILKRPAPSVAAGESTVESASRPSWRQRGGWVLYAAVPSALLLGVTAHISSDIAAAPLLWVVPLTLYLLTFVNAFAVRPLIPPAIAARAMAFAVVLLATLFPWREPAGLILPLHLLAFLAIALGCHGELARRRPAPAALTEFYLFLSIGGLIGGACVALLAPQLFDAVLEYPLAIVLAAALMPHATRGVRRSDLVLIACILAVMLGLQPLAKLLDVPLPNIVFAAVCAVLAVLVLSRQFRPLAFALCVAALLIAQVWTPMREGVLWTGRSFFGVYRVSEAGDPPVRSLIHGTTVHGGQWFRKGVVMPTAYYTESSPVAEVIRRVRSQKDGLQVGAVGLGTGALSYYRQPEDEWRYYEIDPMVRWLAAESGFFQMLGAQDPNADIVTGDARLAIAREQSGRFDLLIMDAYSSDAVPVHLLTREALWLYADKLTDDGILVLHISNRFLDLAPAIGATVASLEFTAEIGHLTRLDEDVDPMGTPSTWVAIARTAPTLERLDLGERWNPLDRSDARVWRDDFSSFVEAIQWTGR
ncbi:MAG: fused MFS/spermidine synthase [Gammaproteobacteria bacterium]|nr:fused MFS/spermidine synthase [Gammaproteobacteria bacterium]